MLLICLFKNLYSVSAAYGISVEEKLPVWLSPRVFLNRIVWIMAGGFSQALSVGDWCQGGVEAREQLEGQQGSWGGGEAGSALCRAMWASLPSVTERTYVNVNKMHITFGLAFRQLVNVLSRLFLQVMCNMECTEVKSHNPGALINSLH